MKAEPEVSGAHEFKASTLKHDYCARCGRGPGGWMHHTPHVHRYPGPNGQGFSERQCLDCLEWRP